MKRSSNKPPVNFTIRAIASYWLRNSEDVVQKYYKQCMTQYLIEDRDKIRDNWLIEKFYRTRRCL